MFMYSVAWNLNRTTVRATITSIRLPQLMFPPPYAIPFIYTHFKYSANIHWPVSITESSLTGFIQQQGQKRTLSSETQPRVVDQVKRCAFSTIVTDLITGSKKRVSGKSRVKNFFIAQKVPEDRDFYKRR